MSKTPCYISGYKMSSLVIVLNLSLQLCQVQQDPKMVNVRYLPLVEMMLNKFVKENKMTALVSLYHTPDGQQTRISTTSRYACTYVTGPTKIDHRSTNYTELYFC